MQFDMTYEARRLASFVSWAFYGSITPIALAKAGLYYTGKDGVTVCFRCDGRITDKDLTGSAMGVHRKLYPQCDFAKGRDRSNVPLGGGETKTANRESPVAKSSEDEEEQTKQTNGSGSTGRRKKKKKPKNKKKANSETGDLDIGLLDIENSPQLQEANRVLKSEYKRLLTFIYWPRNAAALPEDLAKAGFYYCGSDDRVQCFCCYGILKNWRAGDVPSRVHSQYFPSCPFAKGEDVGNAPMRLLTIRKPEADDRPTERLATRDPSRFEDIKGRSVNTGPTVPHEHRAGADKPRRPELSDASARLATFSQSWKGSIPLEHLAEAGFYFTGNGDNVKCFHCDGALRNWVPTDIPWIEHARWFPRCQFVRQYRGVAFMEYVADKYPQPCGQHLPTESQQKTRAKNGTMTGKTLVAQKVNDFMRTDTAQVVLEMGYTKDIVKKVVRRRVQRSGEGFKSTRDLLQAVWDLESQTGGNADVSPGESDGGAEEGEELVGAVGGVTSSFIGETSTYMSGMSSQKEILDELETLRRKKTCKICMDREVCILFQPCRHLVTCDVCAAKVRQCPFCRTSIRSAVRAYMS